MHELPHTEIVKSGDVKIRLIKLLVLLKLESDKKYKEVKLVLP